MGLMLADGCFFPEWNGNFLNKITFCIELIERKTLLQNDECESNVPNDVMGDLMQR